MQRPGEKAAATYRAGIIYPNYLGSRRVGIGQVSFDFACFGVAFDDEWDASAGNVVDFTAVRVLGEKVWIVDR